MIELLFSEEDTYANAPSARPSYVIFFVDNEEPCDAIQHALNAVIDGAK
jgi:hypothetical protein